MKTNIQGIEVECTMDEFLQYLQWKKCEVPQCSNPPSEHPRIARGQFVVNGSRGISSPYAVIIEMNGKTIRANSIREAQRIAGIPHTAFSLSRAFRTHQGPVTVNGIKFTKEQDQDRDKSIHDNKKVIKTSVKINKPTRKQMLKYKLIYPNGDNRLINLTAFCKDNNMDYNSASYRIWKDGEINVGEYIIRHK